MISRQQLAIGRIARFRFVLQLLKLLALALKLFAQRQVRERDEFGGVQRRRVREEIVIQQRLLIQDKKRQSRNVEVAEPGSRVPLSLRFACQASTRGIASTARAQTVTHPGHKEATSKRASKC